MTPSLIMICTTHAFYYMKDIVPSLPMTRRLFNLRTPRFFEWVSEYFKLDVQPFNFNEFEEVPEEAAN